MFKADMLLRNNTLMATFTDDRSITSSDSDSVNMFEKLKTYPNLLQNYLKQWKFIINCKKSTHKILCVPLIQIPQVRINSTPIPKQHNTCNVFHG